MVDQKGEGNERGPLLFIRRILYLYYMNKADIEEIQQDIREVKTLLSNGDTPFMLITTKLASIENKLAYYLLTKKERYQCNNYIDISNKGIEKR